MSKNHRAGYVNIIGMPNAGKSTLMNRLVGEPLAIATAKAQTTRHRILGMVNDEQSQIIFSDTPGYLEPGYQLQKKMQAKVEEALEDADVLVLLIDAKHSELPEEFAERIKNSSGKLIVAINKIDLSDQQKLESLVQKIKTEFQPESIIPISSIYGANLDQLLKAIRERLPESPPYFPKDQLTDKPEKFFVAEIIREKIFELYKQEIPYSCEVKVDSFKEDGRLIRIAAIIFVNRKSQKPILIGKNGTAIKRLGTESRRKIEEFLGSKVFLELHVKVREHWRENEEQLKNFGYE